MLAEATITAEVAASGGLIVDPTCGGGAFLLAALDRLVALGVSPEEALTRVAGIDIDEGALGVAASAVAAWAGAQGVALLAKRAPVRLACADALSAWPPDWPETTVIIGNPPFVTPLRGERWSDEAARWREHHRDLLGPYADLASLHLLAAARRLGRGGRLCFVLPQSMAASRDVAGLRTWFLDTATLDTVWASRRRHFDASVLVWAPVFVIGQRGTAAVSVIGDGGRATARGSRWPDLIASALGVPDVGALDAEAGNRRVLAELVSVSAGFRDEYYGVVPAVREAAADDPDSHPRLVTSGAIDPLHCRWGEAPIRFAKSSWHRPVVDPELATPRAASWIAAERRPKIVVATQTRVIEPVVDRAGTLLAVTPVLSVRADPADLSRVAAVLLAPPVSAWALRRWFGAALTADAIKLAASNVGEIPLPADAEAWDRATEVVDELTAGSALPPGGRAGLHRIAELMVAAYEVPNPAAGELLDWWLARAPTPGR